MPAFYPYVMSSLPALTFGMRPPVSFTGLLAMVKTLVPDEDLEALASVPALDAAPCAKADNPTLAQWLSFNTALRNELVKIRASRKKMDPEKYLRSDGYPESVHAAHIAHNAYRRPSLMEAEKTLDLERWRVLDELAFGHYFDLDALIIYGCRLVMLEKWERINTADGARLLGAIAE